MKQVSGIRSDQDFERTISALRQQVADTLAAIDELERRFAPAPDAQPGGPTPAMVRRGTTPVRTDVIIHNITSPSLARTAHQHIASQDGVMHATVRELAEGTVRITVESERGIGSTALASWETTRPRLTRTETPCVLEIVLDESGAVTSQCPG